MCRRQTWFKLQHPRLGDLKYHPEAVESCNSIAWQERGYSNRKDTCSLPLAIRLLEQCTPKKVKSPRGSHAGRGLGQPDGK